MDASRNRHTYTLKNICIHQSFTVNGSRRLTEGLQYTNTFFRKFANILIQLVLVLMRMMITPSIPRKIISHSLVRHEKGKQTKTVRILFTCMTKSAVATCSARLPIFWYFCEVINDCFLLLFIYLSMYLLFTPMPF